MAARAGIELPIYRDLRLDQVINPDKVTTLPLQREKSSDILWVMPRGPSLLAPHEFASRSTTF